MLHRQRNAGRECAWWTNSLVGQFLHQLSLLQSSRSIQYIQTVPWPKNLMICFVRFFREDQSLLHRPKNSGRECAWWTNSLVGQFSQQLSLLQSSRSIQHMQTVPWPKHLIISFVRFFRGDQSLLHRPRNSRRKCAWWTNSLVGQFSQKLSLLQSSRSVQRMETVPWPKNLIISFVRFLREDVFASQTKKLRKRMCLVDQLPCGSVLTPAISCTKFKIHSAHADSPMTKAFNNLFCQVF